MAGGSANSLEALGYQEVYATGKVNVRLQPVRTYQETSSICETAPRWQTSRQVVRKWLRRYEAEGLSGLEDRPCRPRNSPERTATEIEDPIFRGWERTYYGRHRLALYLRPMDFLSPHMIRHILRRRRSPQKANLASVSIPSGGPGNKKNLFCYDKPT